jgi:hypothetical protein
VCVCGAVGIVVLSKSSLFFESISMIFDSLRQRRLISQHDIVALQIRGELGEDSLMQLRWQPLNMGAQQALEAPRLHNLLKVRYLPSRRVVVLAGWKYVPWDRIVLAFSHMVVHSLPFLWQEALKAMGAKPPATGRNQAGQRKTAAGIV